MLRPHFKMSAGMRNALASLGLLTMALSLAWWEWTAKPEEPVPAQTRSRAGIFPVVVLDPGHGGQDSGAKCGEMLEKDLTLDVGQRIDRLLQAEGLSTVMTRVGDGYISLADRVALANRVPSCVLVSIHFNEGNKPISTGIETYYAEHQIPSGKPIVSWLPFLQPVSTGPPNLESQSLAAYIQEALVARTHAANRGTKAEQFFVIANVRHPAVLVEGGFLSNKEDMAKLTSEQYRDQIAAAIAEGVIRYRNLVRDRQVTLAVTPAGTE